MRIERRYTQEGRSPYADIEFRLTASEIRNPDGSVVFRLEGFLVPEHWSQVAADILAQKYFRKAGVPQTDGFGRPRMDEHGQPITGPETSARQVIHRLAGCWRHWGETHNYFDSAEDAQAFYDELHYWTTPTKTCLDGRTDVECVDYGGWTNAWDEVKGS